MQQNSYILKILNWKCPSTKTGPVRVNYKVFVTKYTFHWCTGGWKIEHPRSHKTEPWEDFCAHFPET